MKTFRLFLLVVSFLSSSSAFSQKWVEMMHDQNINFYDVQKEFNNYWKEKGHVKNHGDVKDSRKKDGGWKQFKRWEWFMEPRVYPSGNRSILNKGITNYNAYRENPERAGVTSAGNWTFLGPNSVPTNGGGAGRLTCIRFDPVNSNTIYAGTPSGGLWKSVNGGQSWTMWNTDNLLTLGISDIAIDPTNSQIIYLGTGDADGFKTSGVGVLKSTDGGITWNTSGLNWITQQGYNVTRLQIDPANTQIIHAATNVGIFRTSNGGTSWTQVHNGYVDDMEMKPGTPTVIYACGNGAIYRSTDSGLSYSAVYTASGAGRIALAVAPSNPNYLYALACSNSNASFSGLYLSSDGGTTFTLQSSSPNILGFAPDGSDTEGQGWYDLTIVVNPVDPDNIFIGGVNIWSSLDKGATWTLTSDYIPGSSFGPYVHADQHDLVFSPGNSSTLFSGNDGGIFKSADGGFSWTDFSNNLEIGQMYRLGQSSTNPNLILSGWQDNGTSLKSSGWNMVTWSDGMECIFDYSDNNIMYTSAQEGYIDKSTDGGNSFTTIVSGGGTGVDALGSWTTPYVIHPTIPTTLLIGKDHLYKSTDGGINWSQLGNMSFGKAIAIAYAPSNPNYIYSASESGSLWVSVDGATFTDRTAGLSVNSMPTYIAVSNTDPAKAWVTFSGYNTGERVYFTSNAGQTWVDYSTGLPNIPINCIVYQNGTNDALYAGTDVGVYYRNASQSSWTSYNNGLPNVIVNELEIQYTLGKIRAATFGRGMWESSLSVPTSVASSSDRCTECIKIFPNPSTGEFDIVLDNFFTGDCKIEISNYLGQRVYSGEIKCISGTYKKHCDLSKSEKGIYLIEVFDKVNKIQKKVIVQ